MDCPGFHETLGESSLRHAAARWPPALGRTGHNGCKQTVVGCRHFFQVENGREPDILEALYPLFLWRWCGEGVFAQRSRWCLFKACRNAGTWPESDSPLSVLRERAFFVGSSPRGGSAHGLGLALLSRLCLLFLHNANICCPAGTRRGPAPTIPQHFSLCCSHAGYKQAISHECR